MDIDESYLAAAQVFADLVSQVPDQMWESPGLGVRSLRELVGHTSTAALSGVLATLDKPAQTIAIASPEAYYAIGRTLDPSVYAAAVAAATATASTHAEALGLDPAFAVRALVKDVAIRLNSADGEQLVQSAAGGMQLSAWLATRNFELTVHTLDIAAATGIATTSTPQGSSRCSLPGRPHRCDCRNRRNRSSRAHTAQWLLRPVATARSNSVERSRYGTTTTMSVPGLRSLRACP